MMYLRLENKFKIYKKSLDKLYIPFFSNHSCTSKNKITYIDSIRAHFSPFIFGNWFQINEKKIFEIIFQIN